MPTPKEVFENPEQFLSYLQSPNMESQCFDRKEVRTESSSQINNIKEEILRLFQDLQIPTEMADCSPWE